MSMDASIKPFISTVDPTLIEKLRQFSPALIGDCYGRRNIMDPGIKPLDPDTTVCGAAVTVSLPPDDNLMLHAALNMAAQGAVLVASTQNDVNSGIWGELMTAAAIERKLAGLVLDGSCRDSKWIRDSGWPLFSRGVCARGSQKVGPGHVNSPISCGHVVVRPGDIIIGDCDGVMVVPAQEVADLIPRCEKKLEQEQNRIQSIKSGSIKPGWLDDSLDRLGCKLS